MIAPPLLDPFETEVTLANEPRVLAFSPRAFAIPMAELLRHLAFDLVGAIPRLLGEVEEPVPPTDGRAPLSYRLGYYQLGGSVLALATEIEDGRAEHRVLELLGVAEDLRVRLNMARLSGDDPLAGTAQDAVAEGHALGQVRIWTNGPTTAGDVRRTLVKQLNVAGLGAQVLKPDVSEPLYTPPAAARVQLDAFPSDDGRVAETLLRLLARLPVEGASARKSRRMGARDDRIRRGTSVVCYRYETHRAGTGVLHVRRREVEAGIERPGLVRTFNVAGLRGAGRIRIREVGGRATAEFAGAPETVEEVRAALLATMSAGRWGRS